VELSERVGAAEARVERARAATERAGAALDQSRADLERAEKLERGGFVSPSAREQAQLAVRVRQKELEAAGFERHAAEHDLSQARAALARARSFGGNGYERGSEWEVRSPVDGRVLKVLKESEDAVDAGVPIVEVGDPRDLEVVLDVLSTEAVRVKPGADVELDAGGGLHLSGKVRLVEPSAFTKVSALGVEEQRVNVIVDLISPPEAWQALGDAYRVDARIVVHRQADAVKVPVAALFRDNAEWAVFVVSEGRADKRRVRISRRGALEAVVEEGLSPGERVIAYPGDAVKDGARLQAISGREM
jgi:HlyD family secretion protein